MEVTIAMIIGAILGAIFSPLKRPQRPASLPPYFT